MEEYNSLRDKHLTGYFAESPNAIDCCADTGLVRIFPIEQSSPQKKRPQSGSTPQRNGANNKQSSSPLSSTKTKHSPAPPLPQSSPRSPQSSHRRFRHEDGVESSSGATPTTPTSRPPQPPKPFAVYTPTTSPADRYEQVLIPFDTERQMRFLNRAIGSLDVAYMPKNHSHHLQHSSHRNTNDNSGSSAAADGAALRPASQKRKFSTTAPAGGSSANGGMNSAFLFRIDQEVGRRVAALGRAKEGKQLEVQEKQKRAMESYKAERKRRLLLQQKWNEA